MPLYEILTAWCSIATRKQEKNYPYRPLKTVMSQLPNSNVVSLSRERESPDNGKWPIVRLLFAYCSPIVRLLFVYCLSIVRLLFAYCSPRSPIFSQHIERLRTGEEATWSSIHRQRHWQLSRFCWPYVMQCRYIRFARWLQWVCWPTYKLGRNTKSEIGCGSKKKAKRLVRWNIL